MASLELYGLDELNDAFRRIADIPEDITAEALDAMAEVAADKIRVKGESLGIRDPESGEHILDKVSTKRKPKITDAGGYKMISFTGTRTRGKTKTRNAEIAFVNEYGKRGQPARPFIRPALAEGEDDIVRPAGKIIGDWIENEYTN
jgi:HK97 gp10 family phage protein